MISCRRVPLLPALFFLAISLLPAFCYANSGPDEPSVEVKEFRLRNGMQFLLVERHTTPQVACRLAIRAGSALEEQGRTGIAHLLEHMMFKGTSNFGTLNPERDRELQDKIESAYQIIAAEQQKRKPDETLIRAKLSEMETLRREVQEIYVPQAISSQLGRNGAVGVNAFTSKDQTQYMASVPSDMLEQWFSIMSEQVFEPSWREFYVEREVVQREWAFRYVNNPQGAAWLDLEATAYRAHPYRNPTIGWKSDMERLSTTDAMAFHRKYYTPNNAVCVLVGDLSLDQARRLAETYFERYPRGPGAPETVTRDAVQQGHRMSVRYLKGARTPVVLLGYHGAEIGTDDFYALDGLTMILSQGRSARLTQEITDKGLAVSAWASNPDNRYGGMIVLGGSPLEPEEVRKEGLSESEQRTAFLNACEGLEKLLLQRVEELKKSPVSDRELARIKKLNHRDFLEKLRENDELAQTLATMEVNIGWEYLNTYLEKMAKVTPEDVQRVAVKYLRTENKTSVYVIPGGEAEHPAEPYTETRSLGTSAALKLEGARSFENRSAFATPPGWKHPLSFHRTPQKIHYPDAATSSVEGVPVFFMPDPELPLIDLTLFVKAGAVDVGDDKAGLASILSGTVVRGGTEEISPAQMAAILDRNAIHLSVSIQEEDAAIRLSMLKEDWEKGMQLLEQVLTRPGFDPKILEVVKKQAVTGLLRQAGDAHAVSMREGLIWHFKHHPYGRDPLLGLDTIPRLTRTDLQAFWKSYFVPSNMIACIAGDIEREAAMKSLGRLFRALPRADATARNLADPKATPPVISLIHKPGQVQSQVFMLLPGIKRTHPDFWKMGLLTSIFGGSESILYTRLRDDLGLVYAAGMQQAYKWNAGLLAGSLGCKADRTVEAIEETVRLMKEAGRDLPEKRIEEKRLDALNSFVFNVDTPLALVETYGRYRMRKEPLDTLSRIQDAYMEARREELLSLAGKYLDPGRLQVFITADKEVRVKSADGTETSLEEAVRSLARRLSLPYQEIPLR
jgi:predicted Zn-dependent peptidase